METKSDHVVECLAILKPDAKKSLYIDKLDAKLSNLIPYFLNTTQRYQILKYVLLLI